jgi:hypothetical protein
MTDRYGSERRSAPHKESGKGSSRSLLVLVFRASDAAAGEIEQEDENKKEVGSYCLANSIEVSLPQ